jgi:hypothetical protein
MFKLFVLLYLLVKLLGSVVLVIIFKNDENYGVCKFTNQVVLMNYS